MNLKLKENLLKLIATILIILFFTIPCSIVYAAKQIINPPQWFGIVELIDNKIGYSINAPNTQNSAKIWNIVKYDSGDTDHYSDDKTLYCIKAEYGFLRTNEHQEKKDQYDVTYDMKTDRELIKEESDVLKKLVEYQITEGDNHYSRYDALLALLDRLYIPGKSPQEEKEKIISQMLNEALENEKFENKADMIEAHQMTDEDIEAAQQMAIWYFTNYEDEEKDEKFNCVGKNGSEIYYTTDKENYQYHQLDEYNSDTSEGEARSAQIQLLYEYLIKQAKANANAYSNIKETTEAPVKILKTKLEKETSDGKTIIGPITAEKVNDLPYTLEIKVSNKGSDVSGYKILDAQKREIKKPENSVEDEIIKEGGIYIELSETEIENFSVTVTVKYNNTTMKLWTSTTKDDVQPIVEIGKEPKSEQVTLTLEEEPEEKPFDLALRKYITAINGQTLTGDKTRVPQIDASKLNTVDESGKQITTATYNHRKHPVTVSKGDKVTYNITIYNEGKKPGYATKIIDQLPTGLKFSQILSTNYTEDDSHPYSEEENELHLLRKSDQAPINAYTSGLPASETITIECEVTATADTQDLKILTNIAWISEAYDSETKKTIIDDQGEVKDRDSQPATHPQKEQQELPSYKGDSSNKDYLDDPQYHYKGEQDDDDFEKLVLLPEAFDLKLIKSITAVNSQDVPNRVKDWDVSKLNTLGEDGKMVTTADYDIDKSYVPVKKGDIVTYTFRIFNEGTIDGYAEEITEDVPEGLEFIWSEEKDVQLQADNNFTEEEKKAIELNQRYLWSKFQYDDSGEKIIQISSNYLSKEINEEENLIKAFGKNDGSKTKEDLKYKEIKVAFKVVAENISGKVIRNEAAITEDKDKDGNQVDDRDSDTETWKKYEDDEDYDNVILQSFDLALRKFIIAVSENETIENNEWLKGEDGLYTRAPQVDTSKLNTVDESGKQITTATYNHPKDPVEVKKGDKVVYMLRVYNEGNIDGYAGEIKDHLPPYLKFIDNSYNKQYGWTVSQDGRTVTTTYLANTIIKKPTTNEEGKIVLACADVPIMCEVTDSAKTEEPITNIADITKYLDDKKQPVEDRDSKEDNVELPSDDELPKYKDDEKGPYVPGQEDDDDFEKVVVPVPKDFDLALRKFITKIEDKIVDSRIPQPSYNKDKDEITYQHGKDPLTVANGNVVEYTIRVFNEGEMNGYAAQVLDDIPDGLEYLPDNATNKEYRWKMYRKLKEGENIALAEGTVIRQDGETYVETSDVKEAEVIVTDYLSKEQGEARMESNKDIKENPNLLKAFNKDAEISATNPDHKDVKVAFKVTEPNSSKKIIVNAAQISKDTDEHGDDVEDRDSEPGKWTEGEDDQDKEYIELKEFDLALRKWVTQAIVIDNGKQTVTQTGHKPYDNPEQVVKVEIVQSRLDKVTVKFRYSIRVTNEGDIEGYAKEIRDYVPQGLKFVASDNPGWKDEGNNVISTKLLENTLLQPGQYADIDVVLTWINSENGLGSVLTNKAEISKDENPYGIPDRDSTPNNKKDGEDDIDDAPVILSIKTGQAKVYFTLGFTILLTAAGGIILIKKYVI